MDARSQLKDNVRFLLRVAPEEDQFSFKEINYHIHLWPTNYVYSDFYSSGIVYGGYNTGFDPLRPMVDNYFYRNFAFDPDNLVANPCIAPAGVSYGWYDVGNFFGDLLITNWPAYYFNASGFIMASNPPAPSSMLSAADTRWTVESSPLEDYLSNNGVFLSGKRNFYGLPYLTLLGVVYTNNQFLSATYNPGDTVPGRHTIFPETAQPEFETVEYDFWNQLDAYGNLNPTVLPGGSAFSMTHTNP